MDDEKLNALRLALYDYVVSCGGTPGDGQNQLQREHMLDAVEAEAKQLASAEVCICAAIRLPDGKIFRGHRHHDCIAVARLCTDGDWHPSNTRDQGFITSHNRYVDREEGLRLQKAAGIESVRDCGYRATELFSEDLY